jgi:RNA polymerase sigma factor (sigma-70 family)
LSDWFLITKYVMEGSDKAFADLVRRYMDLVYAVCLRELRSPQLAEDAAQAVFLLLAMKASTFRQRQMLPSWLFKAAVLTARNMRRTEARRARREQIAWTVDPHVDVFERDPQAEPLLNDALLILSDAERKAVLLRFMSSASFGEIGDVLSIKENTARMRVNRSLKKMRRFMERRGVVLSTVAIAVVLPAATTPVNHALAILNVSSYVPSAGGSGLSIVATQIHQIALGVNRSMAILKLKTAALTAGFILAGAGSVAAFHMSQPRHVVPVVVKDAPAPPPLNTPDDLTYAGAHIGESMSEVLKKFGTPTSVWLGATDDATAWNSLIAPQGGPQDRALPTNARTTVTWNYASKDGRQLSFLLSPNGKLIEIGAGGADAGDTTALHAKLGMDRTEVSKLYGFPERQVISNGTWTTSYADGHSVVFQFKNDKLVRIIIAK